MSEIVFRGGIYAVDRAIPDNPLSLFEIATNYATGAIESGAAPQAVPPVVREAAALSFYIANVSYSRPDTVAGNAEWAGYARLALTWQEGLDAAARMLDRLGETALADALRRACRGEIDGMAEDTFFGHDPETLATKAGSWLAAHQPMRALPYDGWEESWKAHLAALPLSSGAGHPR